MPRDGVPPGAGRQAADCIGLPLSTYSFHIHPEDSGVLNRLGDGNRSLGLRRSTNQARAPAIMPTRPPAREASPSGKAIPAATAGDK
jgi:hypothetical protein